LQTDRFEAAAGAAPLFTFGLSFLIADFQSEWKRCNMAANYIAAYAAYQFAQRERAENLISTIANELFETAVKIALPQSDLLIRYTQFENGLRLDSVHSIPGEAAASYLTLLDDLKEGDNDTRYLNLLTSEQAPENCFNQLGLTMIVHDFGAQLTARLKGQTIYTQVFIPIKELDE